MIATQKAESKSKHPLSRFVTPEAISLLLNLETKDIYRIGCWRYVIHVVGKGVSKFVSYADLPPILGVESPSDRDFVRWRKRWRKNNQQAPKFWLDFYKQKFKQAVCVGELYAWGTIVGVIKPALSPVKLQELRIVYIEVKNSLKPLVKTAAV
ncbi:MAG TPA: hypothetical protein DEV81_05580 [Cyanobacteria bacterium UBA11049]|nr:hypothetical protein [Cyanobacteria bacterium UBA11049]